MKLYIEPNNRGGWSLRWEGYSSADALGNYATPTDAARVAKYSFADEIVVVPEAKAVGESVIPQHSCEQRLVDLGLAAVCEDRTLPLFSSTNNPITH